MKYYKIYLSNKQSVVIEENEFEAIEGAMSSGTFVRAKKAIINPSFVVSVVPITAEEALEGEPRPKVEGYIKDNKYVITGGKELAPTGLSDEFKT